MDKYTIYRYNKEEKNDKKISKSAQKQGVYFMDYVKISIDLKHKNPGSNKAVVPGNAN